MSQIITRTTTSRQPGLFARRPRVDLRRPVSVPTLVVVAVLIAFAVFLAVRLGPALLGFRVFAGVDILLNRSPWTDGSVPPVPHNWYLGDTIDSTFPQYLEMHSALWSGHLPLWSNVSGAGTALLALPYTPTLTPTSFWMLIFPTGWALSLVKLTQMIVAFAGMSLFLRRVGATRAAAAIGGLFYCASGFLTAWSNWAGQISVGVLIPALFWAVERYLATRTIRSALPVSAVVAFLLFGGFPAVAGHALYTGAAYFLVRLIADRRAHSVRNSLITLAGGIGAVLLGVAISGIQLLPMLHSLAGTDMVYRDAQFTAVQPIQSMWSFFFPRVFNPTGYPASNPIEAYSYVGLGAAALILLALVAGNGRRAARGVVTVLVVTMMLAGCLVWFHGWWVNWLSGVPIFQGNNPGRFRDLVCFAGSALAGIGADLLFRRVALTVRRRLLVTAWLALPAAFVLCVLIWAEYHATMRGGTFAVDAALGLASVLLVALTLRLGPLTTADHLMIGRARPGDPEPEPASGGAAAPPAVDRSGRAPTRRRLVLGLVAALGLVAVSGIQAGNSVAYFWPLSPAADFYPESDGIRSAQQAVGQNRGVGIGAFLGSTSSAYGIRYATGHTFAPDSWKEMLLTIDPMAYSGRGQSATNPGLHLTLSNGLLQRTLFDRLAVSTVVVGPTQQIPGPPHGLDGIPVDPTADGGPDRVAVRQGTGTTAVLIPQKIRGIEVKVATPVTGSGQALALEVAVTDPAGRVVATGAVARPRFHAGWLQIPVAGEDLDRVPGPLKLTITGGSSIGPKVAIPLAGRSGRVSIRTIGSQSDGLVETYADSRLSLWHRPSFLPRVRWASTSLVRTTTLGRLQLLVDPNLSDDTVVLSTEPAQAPSGKPAKVSLVGDTGARVDIGVAAQGSGFVVLADPVQSQWQVTVDGVRSEVVAADHALGAVFVPAGRHVVEFSYVGSGLRTGAAVSAASLLIVVGLLVLTGRNGRRGLLIRQFRRFGKVPAGRPQTAGQAGDPIAQ